MYLHLYQHRLSAPSLYRWWHDHILSGQGANRRRHRPHWEAHMPNNIARPSEKNNEVGSNNLQVIWNSAERAVAVDRERDFVLLRDTMRTLNAP